MKRLPPVDKDKLRTKLRQLDDARLFELVDRAINLLPPTKLRKWVAPYFSTEDLAPDQVEGEIKPDVLRAVKEFQRKSLAGEYYQSFMVNSKNCMEKSRKTMAWITDINRLFERCCQQTSGTYHKEAREAFEILFELLFAIDRDLDMIVFFADEGGSWQVGCDWQRILPSYFRCLAATATPDDYPTNVLRVVDGFVRYDRVRYLTAARKTAGKNQKKALNAAEC